MKKHGELIFVIIAVIIISFVLYKLTKENHEVVTAQQKCENAGWVWFSSERKCLMIKEVK